VIGGRCIGPGYDAWPLPRLRGCRARSRPALATFDLDGARLVGRLQDCEIRRCRQWMMLVQLQFLEASSVRDHTHANSYDSRASKCNATLSIRPTFSPICRRQTFQEDLQEIGVSWSDVRRVASDRNPWKKSVAQYSNRSGKI